MDRIMYIESLPMEENNKEHSGEQRKGNRSQEQSKSTRNGCSIKSFGVNCVVQDNICCMLFTYIQ